MYTLNQHFSKLLSVIEPDSKRAELAQDIPSKIREYIKKHPEIITVEPQSRLAGSYARKTAIGDIKDVDILIFLESRYLKDSPEEVLTTLNDILQGLPEAIDDIGKVELRKQRRSINIHLEKYDFDLDIVPAIAPNGKDRPVQVPDRGWEHWLASDPLGYSKYLSEINQNNDGMIVPLVKLFKFWRNYQMVYRKPKSYWLETMIVRHVSNGWTTVKGISAAEGFRNLLDSFYTRYESYLQEDGAVPDIPDSMLGNDIAFNWERSHFETFMRRVADSLSWANKALADDITREKAIELWKKVFGEDFPSSVEEDAKKAASSVKDGVARVSSAGALSIVKGVAVQEHRFFGGDGKR